MSLNKVMIIGCLGKDPELRMTTSGTQVANFSVATSERWTDKAGDKQEKTEWHRIVLWDKLAELAGKYLKKGVMVYIEGKLQTRSWEDKGEKKYATEIVGTSMTFLDKKGDSQEASEKPKPIAKKQARKDDAFPDEDVPF